MKDFRRHHIVHLKMLAIEIGRERQNTEGGVEKQRNLQMKNQEALEQ
jgi:hypothetical protein